MPHKIFSLLQKFSLFIKDLSEMADENQILEPVETVEEIDVTAKEWIQQQSDKEVVKSF